MVLRISCLLASAKRIPLIKFRKGGPTVTSTSVSDSGHSHAVAATQGVRSISKTSIFSSFEQ